MSAIGIYCSAKEILLFSDGLSFNSETNEVATKRACKIIGANSHCSILTMGHYGVDVLNYSKDFIKGFGNVENLAVVQIAHFLGIYFRMMLQEAGVPESEQKDYLNLIVGYQQGQPALYELFYENEDKFKPEEKSLSPGTGIAIAVNTPADRSGFQESVDSYLNMGADPRRAASRAFRDFVETHPDYGTMIGGSIFEERLSPKGDQDE